MPPRPYSSPPKKTVLLCPVGTVYCTVPVSYPCVHQRLEYTPRFLHTSAASCSCLALHSRLVPPPILSTRFPVISSGSSPSPIIITTLTSPTTRDLHISPRLRKHPRSTLAPYILAIVSFIMSDTAQPVARAIATPVIPATTALPSSNPSPQSPSKPSPPSSPSLLPSSAPSPPPSPSRVPPSSPPRVQPPAPAAAYPPPAPTGAAGDEDDDEEQHDEVEDDEEDATVAAAVETAAAVEAAAAAAAVAAEAVAEAASATAAAAVAATTSVSPLPLDPIASPSATAVAATSTISPMVSDSIATSTAMAVATTTAISPMTSEPIATATVGMSAKKVGRSLQHVLTCSNRMTVAKWMVEESNRCNSEKNIISKSVQHFPDLFGGTAKANLMKASRIWRDRARLIEEAQTDLTNPYLAAFSLAQRTRLGVKRDSVKARPGRGRKREAWVDALHRDLHIEFSRFRKAGLRMNTAVLRLMALHLLQTSKNEAYSASMVDSRSKKTVVEVIKDRWVQSFMDRFHIVVRGQNGKLMTAEWKRVIIHKSVAYHLGRLKREFYSGTLNEDCVESGEAMHFVFNPTTAKTMGFVGDPEVGYSDAVCNSADVGMTVVVRITGGAESHVAPPLVIFQSDESQDDTTMNTDMDRDDISFRHASRGWVEQSVLAEYFRESRNMQPLSNGRKRVLFMDDCSQHTISDELQEALRIGNMELRYLPPNAGGLVQAADTVARKIKEALTRRWVNKVQEFASEAVTNNDVQAKGGIPFGEKEFLVEAVRESVAEVNDMRGEDRLRITRRAMIGVGLARNTNGLWEEEQLLPELQEIVRRHRNHFDGAPVEYVVEGKDEKETNKEEVKEEEMASS